MRRGHLVRAMLTCAWLTGGSAHAQGAPPVALQAGSPDANTTPPAAPPPPDAAGPNLTVDPRKPSADPAPDLPKGTIDIEVVDAAGRPFVDGEIVLGVMQSMGGRTEQRARTDAAGRYTFRALPVGSAQAYRVNVLSSGAKFSSNPFRLPDDSGFRVRIPLRPTTRDDRLIFSVIGQSVIELRDDRLYITQEVRVANAGETVFVFPENGMLVTLPSGFTAFQWQEQMTDQRGTEVVGEGFRLKGSIPPGTLSLAWTFDLPRDGARAHIPVSLPFRTYTYRVIAEAPEGLTLRVTDFPAAERVKDQGRNLLFTQLRRVPPDPHLGPLTIRLEGIPGPGPGRWVAVALSVCAVLFGLGRALRTSQDPAMVAERKRLLADRKASLLDAARKLEAEHACGDIGPQYLARKLDEIEIQLATVLRDEALLT